jgi:hypothetical protein
MTEGERREKDGWIKVAPLDVQGVKRLIEEMKPEEAPSLDFLGAIREIGRILTATQDWNADTMNEIAQVFHRNGWAGDGGLFEFVDPTTNRKRVYRCGDCGNPDVEGEAWIHLNTNEPNEHSGDDVYCACCDDADGCAGHDIPLCEILTNESGARCIMHDERDDPRCCLRFPDQESDQYRKWAEARQGSDRG